MAYPRPRRSYRHTLGVLALSGTGAMLFALGVRVGTEGVPAVDGGRRSASVTSGAVALVPAPIETVDTSSPPADDMSAGPAIGAVPAPGGPDPAETAAPAAAAAAASDPAPKSGAPVAPADDPPESAAPLPLLETSPLLDAPLVNLETDLPVDAGGLGGTLSAVEQVANLGGVLGVSIR